MGDRDVDKARRLLNEDPLEDLPLEAIAWIWQVLIDDPGSSEELDAMRKLAEQVYGLQISSTTTVRDFVTEYDEISSQVQAVLVGAVAGQPVFRGGVAEVTVSMPAAEVWSVVHQHMLIVERRG